MKYTVFLPCRAGSQRVKNKNVRKFADTEGGLLRIKLEQLKKIDKVSEIILSTNDPAVIKIAEELNIDKLKIDVRPEHLCTSETSTDDLINYIPEIIKDGIVIWTHVTSPFLDEKFYNKAIEVYEENTKDNSFDSLMSVLPLQGFFWNENGPITYDRQVEKWPRTQTIKKIFEIDSGIFINSIENYKRLQDRIGYKPFLFETNKIDAFEIDWEEDFFIAEQIYRNSVIPK